MQGGGLQNPPKFALLGSCRSSLGATRESRIAGRRSGGPSSIGSGSSSTVAVETNCGLVSVPDEGLVYASRNAAFEILHPASDCARTYVTMPVPPAGYILARSLMASTPPKDPHETDCLLRGAARGDQVALPSLLKRHRERLRRMEAILLNPDD